ncbi:type III-A CRISPR-associated protein Cas10/Csm1 [Brasilonema sp. UFV-L1]|uniref:type III-A CRISPR-associated protein Cas10/Csm1 n=1 Tax=Brasilonema sp. UFV-L1 TaxID=2234130 RepID=UPI00145E1E15|nr:type III-A CRISPR-associated protein Cas10/Csm1 [Brasilonema sp. UFV-L1]NMG09346.1 type III-A CRISPR-associated protein Cas10/Csm1 [Brasilonema sp. UFV-L1]
MTDSKATDAALPVAQQAVWVLAQLAGVQLLSKWYPEDSKAIQQAKCILWCNKPDILWSKEKENSLTPLRLLFDQVQLSQCQTIRHYWEATYIKGLNPQIPYPQKEESPEEKDIEFLKQRIQRVFTLEKFNDTNWKNLSLLTLILEKFGSYVSLNHSDIALIDMVRATGAVAAALANNLEAKQLRLIAGDLSGIQKFIYTISSAGALKSLRARSFYLELVTEEVVQQLLQKLELPRTNVIYAGGGNLYLLAPIDTTEDKLKEVSQRLNNWLVEEFQGKVFLALDHVDFPIKDVATQEFATHWSKVTQKLSEQKSRKFVNQIVDFLKPRDSHTPCKVCHRDDLEELQPLSDEISVEACPTCRKMFELGGKLLKVQAIVRSPRDKISDDAFTLTFKLSDEPVYYHIFKYRKQVKETLETETVYLVNDWMIYHYYRSTNTVPFLLGNYAQKSEEEEPGSPIRAGEMARIAKGIERVGYLRMDVDRLGQIFAKGLGDNRTLPNLAGLSRQMSYFFKVYLNSLAENRQENFLKQQERGQVLKNTKSLTQDERKNLVFIYAGGDDVFVSGAWNEVVEFAFDVYQCFRAYTGNHPDITLSAGISIDDIKFPLYQAAESSGKAEDAAKGNGRDSLGLFGQVFKWDEWLGIEDINLLDSEMKQYLHPEAKPNLLGVLPFVEILEQQKIEVNYSRNFVRNLLITAQIQEQALKKFEDRKSQEALGTRYYLHLPKIAYTLARLPNRVLDNNDFRTSLKSPYNAPYFRAIATWIELLNRSSNYDTTK